MSKRGKALLVAATVVVVAAAIVVPIEVATRNVASRPVVTPTVVTPSRPSAPSEQKFSGYTPPVTVNDTCSSDDTEALTSWLYSLPVGSPAKPTIVHFRKGACYQVNGELYLRGFRSLFVDGEGATFKQAAPPTCPVKGNRCANRAKVSETSVRDNPTTAPYCGSDAYMNDGRSEDSANDTMWDFEGGCDITFEDLKIEGTNTGAGRARETDSFISFAGTQRALVDDVTETDPYGDYVDCSGLHEAGIGASFPCTDLTVEHSTFSGAGRVGFGLIVCERVAIEDNTISSAAATVFDIEIDSLGGLQTDIDIDHNTIVGQRYAYLLSAQTGGKIERLRFSDNKMTDKAQMRVVIKDRLSGSDVQVSGNTWSAASSASGGTWPAVRITGIEGDTVAVDHNSGPLNSHGLASLPTGAVHCEATCPPIRVTAPTPPALPQN
jgi:Right handed beta helix region